MKSLRTALVIGLAFLATCPARAGDDLATRINSVIDGPDYRQAHWGILVIDTESGRTLFARDPDKLFLPASTTKLYSCAAALHFLGPDYRFRTPVYRRGTFKDGRLDGDLILVAQGDLTLGGRTDAEGRLAFTDHDHIYATGGTNTKLTDTDPLAGLKMLARRVAEAGVHSVHGDVLIDDRLFDHGHGSGSGPAVLTPIVVNDNVVDVTVTPAAEPGKPASVRMRPETGYLQMDAQVETVAAGKAAHLEVRGAEGRGFTVRGQVPAGSKPHIAIYDVPDPAAFARALFIEALRGAGVTVSASLLREPEAQLPEREAYAHLERVASFTSPPFSEVIKVTLKVSHNLYASTLPFLVAAKHGKRTLADGLRLQRQFLAELGIDVASISFAGGAGGNNADAVTPRASVQLLQALQKRPDFKFLHAGLPVLGVDGTLSTAVPASSPARGRVWAKTGTLEWEDGMNDRALLTSKALAGTMVTAKGRPLTVAIYVNMVPLPKGVTPAREGQAIGRLCEIIYANAP
jgi:D-alanyl-D-alanine carboxypeptidase/D-alanyl-D-alanine-endopeptidase (penicillin-binding protein 4)